MYREFGSVLSNEGSMKTQANCSLFTFFCIASTVSAQKENTDAVPERILLIPTFHCMSVYWSPANGDRDTKALVKFRAQGKEQWRTGLPLRYHPIDSPECKGDYRGSLVNLEPGTSYEVALSLEGTDKWVQSRESTWSERFPVGSTISIPNSDSTVDVDKSGKPDAYVLYDGTGCTIDLGNRGDIGIAVNASYVILRGFTIKNVKEHGIRIFNGHHIVIEDCDISRWGSESEQGWGKNYQACIFSNNRDLHAVIIQRCKMHHPAWDTNSWAEKHGQSTHPQGPQTIVFWESEGNHVIRYNECWSDENHYFNDGMGAGKNGSHRGFPGADSDIYCNYVASCRDDGIEAEGGDQNVRIWNNYVEDVLIPIANAAVSIGPLYVWRNVSGRSYSPPGSSWDMTHGPFMKMGYAGGEHWMTGHMYVFNNTIFQQQDNGSSGLGGESRIIKHCVSRNNILHVRDEDKYSIAKSDRHEDNDFDFDLISGNCPAGQEKHALKGKPQFVPGAGFDRETRSGLFQLKADSIGADAAGIIPNFCEPVNGNPPDVGAHEQNAKPVRFGVKALFIPPEPTRIN